MTPAQIVTWTALAITAAVVFWRGRRPERLGMIAIIAAFVTTPFVQRLDRWDAPQFGIMAVDASLLAVLALMAFRYGRFWLIWAAAFQTVTVLTHLAFLIDPKALYRAFYFGNFAMGYLLLGAILGGAIIEREEPVPRPAPSSPDPLRGRAP